MAPGRGARATESACAPMDEALKRRGESPPGSFDRKLMQPVQGAPYRSRTAKSEAAATTLAKIIRGQFLGPTALRCRPSSKGAPHARPHCAQPDARRGAGGACHSTRVRPSCPLARDRVAPDTLDFSVPAFRVRL